MRKVFVTLSFFWLVLHGVHSQNSEVFLGANLPLNYAAGYQQRINNKLSVNFQAGVLTKPFNTIIIDVIEYFDADENVVATLNEAKTHGFNLQLGLKYHVKKYYFGLSYGCLMIKGQDYMDNVLYNLSGLTFEFPRNSYLTLHSYLHNGGVFAGRQIRFKNPRIGVNLELGFQKTFYSYSYMDSDSGQRITSLSVTLDKDLNQYYVEYGYLPTINVYFTYIVNRRK